MYKKSLYKTLHKNFFLCNKWNTIQLFTIGAQLYQQWPTAI